MDYFNVQTVEKTVHYKTKTPLTLGLMFALLQ